MKYFDISDLIDAIIANYLKTRKSKNQNILIKNPQKSFEMISSSFDKDVFQYILKTGHDVLFKDFYEGDGDVWRIESIMYWGGLLPVEARLVHYYTAFISAWDYMKFSTLPTESQFNLLRDLLEMLPPKDYKFDRSGIWLHTNEFNLTGKDREGFHFYDEESESDEEGDYFFRGNDFSIGYANW